MTTTEPVQRPQRAARRPPTGARRAGYVLAAAINVLFLWLVNVTPGWRWVPFLTEDFGAVLGLVNLSLLVAVAINLAYVAADPPWAKHLGDAATAAIACGVLFRLVAVFPVEFGAAWSGWEGPFRAVLALGGVGAAIAVVVNLVMLLRDGSRPVTGRS